MNPVIITPSPATPTRTVHGAGRKVEIDVEHGWLRSEHFWFYDARALSVPDLYGQLLASARSQICVWDGWVYERDSVVLAGVRAGVLVRVLAEESHQSLSRKRAAVAAFRSGASMLGTSLSVVFRSLLSDAVNQCVHDRFLLIDPGTDTEQAFVVGASLGSHHGTPKRSHSIVRLGSAADRALLRLLFESFWDVATEVTP